MPPPSCKPAETAESGDLNEEWFGRGEWERKILLSVSIVSIMSFGSSLASLMSEFVVRLIGSWSLTQALRARPQKSVFLAMFSGIAKSMSPTSINKYVTTINCDLL